MAIRRLQRFRHRELGTAPAVIYVAGCYGVFSLEELLRLLGALLVRVFGSGEGKINWAALGDVLQFAVQALDHPAAHNATLELNGPDWLSQMDVIHLCEEIGGRQFAIQRVPEETLQEQANTATDEYGQTFAILMLCVARGQSHAVDMQETLQSFPVHLTSVRDYARTAQSK